MPTMEWRKIGLIFAPKNAGGWMKTHAQVPTPLLCNGYLRVYFASRPKRNLSLTSFVDLDADDPTRIIRINSTPILLPGKPGAFDEHGIMPSCAIREGSRVFLYYSGWSRSVSVPYTNYTGLAISEDGGDTFEKVSDGPILGKSRSDPYSATSSVVLKEQDSWHMWYCSGTAWLKIGEKYEHTYDIKYAGSGNGIDWRPSGEASIVQKNKEEAITRPFVLKDNNGYQMWFCYRGSRSFRNGNDAYRIGYAHSDDLRQWQRDDNKNCIGPSETGWDSKMVAYPALIRVKASTLMFYNGNDFGASGFGVAMCEETRSKDGLQHDSG
jgi:predicted GH43/DUF377 family glycosyl hydrolase